MNKFRLEISLILIVLLVISSIAISQMTLEGKVISHYEGLGYEVENIESNNGKITVFLDSNEMKLVKFEKGEVKEFFSSDDYKTKEHMLNKK